LLITENDRGFVRRVEKRHIPGDYNDDGLVNLADLAVVQTGLGDAFGRPDAATVLQNLGTTNWPSSSPSPSPTAAHSVPEPSTLILAMIALPGIFTARHSRPAAR
jgi:hypothetical protein